jgi:uncharacterized membrane protein YdbT with pleckstrin-like domain
VLYLQEVSGEVSHHKYCDPARRHAMYVVLQPMVALIAGILILVIPRLLNYIVAIYLIAIGILGLLRM